MADSIKDHVAGLAIQIPEKMITDVIRAEVIKAVPEPQKWVEAIVDRALKEKKNTYDSATIFEKTISEMIRKECGAVFAEWLEEHRLKIRDSLVTALSKGKAKRIKEIAEHIATGMKRVYVNSVILNVQDNHDD